MYLSIPSYTYPFLRLSIHSLIYPSIHSLIYPSIPSSIHSFPHLSIHSLIYMYLSIPSSIYSFPHLSIHSLIHLSIHSIIYLSIFSRHTKDQQAEIMDWQRTIELEENIRQIHNTQGSLSRDVRSVLVHVTCDTSFVFQIVFKCS